MNKKMLTGWLVMAAALTMTLAACSSDDNVIDEPIQPTGTATTMHVTVGAGISDGTTTRATVDDSQTDANGKTLRTLKFTDGDQLYVFYRGNIDNYWYDVWGTLTTTSSNIGANGLTAQFSGDLTVNKSKSGGGEGEIPDPDLSLLTDKFATLMPANHGASMAIEHIGSGTYECNYYEGMTATETLNEAIARHSYVRGEIDALQNVTLTAESAFLNCTVTGLDATTAYDVRIAKDADPVSVTTDETGAMHFVAWFKTDGWPLQYTIYVGNNKRVQLGEKTLAAGKVYNVNRVATDFTPLTVTNNATSTTVEPKWGDYSFDGSADITVTGEGETINLWASDNTVTLSGVTATSKERFIYGNSNGGTLTIVLSGANNITITNSSDPMWNPTQGGQAIRAEGDLKLSGNGTLTVTVTDANYYGLCGVNNYAYFGGDEPNNNNGDASVLAAPGYTVNRSDVTNNSDGTYTWTYTVAPLPAGALAGRFTINADGDKVFFSKGNLQATYDGSAWTWAFAENQWDYIGGRSYEGSETLTGNNYVTTSSPFISTNGIVDLFGWVGASSTWTGVNMYGITSAGTEATNRVDGYGYDPKDALKADWGTLAISNGGNTANNGWRTLTSDEWTYLFSTREVNGGTGSGYSYTIGQSVNGVAGAVLYPDNFTGAAYSSSSDWATFEAAGCVFLPAAGNRDYTCVDNAGTVCVYWSSTASSLYAYGLKIITSDGSLFTEQKTSRSFGKSVRLVRPVE